MVKGFFVLELSFFVTYFRLVATIFVALAHGEMYESLTFKFIDSGIYFSESEVYFQQSHATVFI